MDAPFLVEGDDKDVQLSGGAQEGPRRGWWNWQVDPVLAGQQVAWHLAG